MILITRINDAEDLLVLSV